MSNDVLKKTSDPRLDGKLPDGVRQRCLSSDELFRGRREVRIVHAGQEYRLFVTSKDKLILTK